ncbi:MAG: DUF1778 domain-containing protein [Acetobacteraceae bacterium]
MLTDVSSDGPKVRRAQPGKAQMNPARYLGHLADAAVMWAATPTTLKPTFFHDMRFQSAWLDSCSSPIPRHELKSHIEESDHAQSQRREQSQIHDGNSARGKGPPGEKARLVRAASLEHTTLKDFMLRNASSAAEAVIERAERITLSERDTRKILDLLDHPREPDPHMVAILKARPAK